MPVKTLGYRRIAPRFMLLLVLALVVSDCGAHSRAGTLRDEPENPAIFHKGAAE